MAVIVTFLLLGYKDIRGHWPFMKSKESIEGDSEQDRDSNNLEVGEAGLSMTGAYKTVPIEAPKEVEEK